MLGSKGLSVILSELKGSMPLGHMENIKYRYRLWPLVVALAFAWALVFVDHLHAKGGEIQGRRVALIVGNSNYNSVYSLKNAVSDSSSVSAVLSRLGFEVIEVSDVTRSEFSKALDKFSAAAQDAEAAVFYYSGHGFQLGGSNFLVPVDAKLNNRDTILKETLRLNDVIKAVQDKNRQTLIFLDACRNNPLPESVRGKTMVDGLAQLEAGTGTFVAFATQPGNITRDGAGDHSPFAAALIEHMETPGISISDMMIRVRNSVEVATLETQTPWDQSSLRNQFYFSPEEEVGASLTDEDKELLLSLPPALRNKFAAQFGIKFSDDGKILSQTVEIKPRFQISSGKNKDSPEKPVAKKKQAIKGRFKIAAGGSGGSGNAADGDVVVANLEPKNRSREQPELSPLDDELASNGKSFVPLPNFRPQAKPVERQEDQLVAALSPRDTKPETAQRIEPVIEATTEIAKAPESTTAPKTIPEITDKTPVTPKVTTKASKPVQVTPKQVKPQSSTPVITKNVGAPAKPRKPRVIAITNPELAKTPEIEANKDVQVAVNSAARSIETLKPTTGRSSLRPVASSAKRLVGKEVNVGGAAGDKPAANKPKVQVASLEPVVKTSSKREEELPTVAPVGLEDTTAAPKKEPKKENVKVASLNANNATNNSRSDEEIAPVKEPSITPPSRALEVQTELARLGCYRSKIDGLWGANSARALFRYYGNKKIAPTELEPNSILLSMLQGDEVVVCKRTIKKIKPRPKKSTIATKGSKASRSARKKKGKRIRIRKSVSIRKKALKKSLSKGVFR